VALYRLHCPRDALIHASPPDYRKTALIFVKRLVNTAKKCRLPGGSFNIQFFISINIIISVGINDGAIFHYKRPAQSTYGAYTGPGVRGQVQVPVTRYVSSENYFRVNVHCIKSGKSP
jgi:hypothetical protein